MSKQIKSKKRVSDFGEVYTAKKQVDEMLALIPDNDINTTYLEPACGNGNFLVGIIQRKLSLLSSLTDRTAFRYGLLLAVSTIYGMDIQADNVIETRERLLDLIQDEYYSKTGTRMPEVVRIACGRILGYNIVCGNTLTMTFPDGSPLLFSEWSFRDNGYVIRKEYSYADMIQNGGESLVCVRYHRYAWFVDKKLREVA